MSAPVRGWQVMQIPSFSHEVKLAVTATAVSMTLVVVLVAAMMTN